MVDRRAGGGRGSGILLRDIVQQLSFEPLSAISSSSSRSFSRKLYAEVTWHFPLLETHRHQARRNNVNIETSLLVIKHSRAGRILFKGNGGENGRTGEDKLTKKNCSVANNEPLLSVRCSIAIYRRIVKCQ